MRCVRFYGASWPGRGWVRSRRGRGVDRKTARRYVQAAHEAGLTRDCGPQALTDELVVVVVGAVRPSRPNGHGDSWEMLLAHQKRIATWVGRDKLSIVKVDQLLTRPGVNVPYRTFRRFAVQRCGFRPKDTTVPVMINFHGGRCPTLAAMGKGTGVQISIRRGSS